MGNCPETPVTTCVSFVTDGGYLACRYDLTDEVRIQIDTRQLELWAQEDIVIDPQKQQQQQQQQDPEDAVLCGRMMNIDR